jgi:hypothetical protein
MLFAEGLYYGNNFFEIRYSFILLLLFLLRNFIILFFAIYSYNQNVQVKEDEMDRSCSTHVFEAECIYDFRGKARKKERKIQLGRPVSR